MMVSSRQNSINVERRNGKRFPERGRSNSKVKNIAGLIEDVNNGGDPKSRRFEARPVLQDTGNLLGSIAFQIEGKDTVSAGTKLEYAQTQVSGFGIEKQLTETGRQRLAEFLDKNTEYVSELGFLFRTGKYSAKVKARDFISFEEEELKEYDALAIEYMTR
jgi:hypothetical protein